MSEPETRQLASPMQYRLVVRSAAEAVALVQERFGSGARVLAVRQLEAGGLARFLQKPRLEVIVEAGVASPAASEEVGEEPREKLTLSSAIASQRVEKADTADEEPEAVSEPEPRTAARPTRDRVDRAQGLLRAAGIDESILERVRGDEQDFDWSAATAPEVMGRLAVWLRRQYGASVRRPVSNRRVFLGSCGAGKTTALCKTLALEVFVRGSKPAVLKLDGAHPNATDGLAAFCDVLNTPLLRSAGEIEEFERDTVLMVDVPGVGLHAHADQKQLVQTLDALGVETRILVVNAACEVEVIADAYEMGRACGATHVVFTHLDEVRRPGKLWRFALFGGLTPLAVCSGPSPADELEEDVFAALLSRSFPASLARAAQADAGGER